MANTGQPESGGSQLFINVEGTFASTHEIECCGDKVLRLES